MIIQNLIDDLNKEITEKYEAYTKLHLELQKYRGIQLEDEHIDIVNKLLIEISDLFLELHPSIHFIGYRYQWAVNVTNEFHDYLEALKKAGAYEIKPPRKD